MNIGVYNNTRRVIKINNQTVIITNLIPHFFMGCYAIEVLFHFSSLNASLNNPNKTMNG
ncbi:hypothetical protein I4U23_015938 [Adineta vaga]|nr:hypothetical protein I4U23_015938 [Adineta vaga]